MLWKRASRRGVQQQAKTQKGGIRRPFPFSRAAQVEATHLDCTERSQRQRINTAPNLRATAGVLDNLRARPADNAVRRMLRASG